MSESSSDINDAAPLPEDLSTASSSNPRQCAGELLNTSSFARRLAHGQEPTERDQDLSTHSSEKMAGSSPHADRVYSDLSFQQCPNEVISSSIARSIHSSLDEEDKDKVEAIATTVNANASESEHGSAEPMTGAAANAVTKSESNISGDVSTATSSREIKADNSQRPDEVAPPARLPSGTLSRPPLVKNSENNNNKNAIDAFGEYIAFFFKKAEVYEEELELRQSQRNLQMRMDRTRHGSSRWNMSPEGGGSTSSEDSIIDGKVDETAVVKDEARISVKLSSSMEALAAVDAMSNFRSLTDSRNQLKKEHSLRWKDEPHIQKKEKVEDDAPIERMEVVDESIRKEWKEQWENFVQHKKKNKFNEVAIQSLALPLSVNEFCHHVIGDDATHSIGSFMSDIGELNVDTTPWSHATDDATEPSTRIIQYTHPVNAPMAPPTAKARKQQYLHKFGAVGMCLETCTVVEEVPMADCFVVNDRLWVHEAEEGNDGCIVAVTFEIKFVKYTMFRRIIENTTRTEYESFWNQFADMIKTLKSPSAMEEEELQEVATELEEATAMLGGEGTEVPISSALSRIRSSSRRLSDVARFPSTRKITPLEGTKERQEEGAYGLVTFALDGVAYMRELVSESEHAFALACVALFFMLLLNFLAVRQMMLMNGFLQNLDARLEKMNELNEALLLKLAHHDVCGDGQC